MLRTVRPKNGSYTPATHDYNQIRRMQTIGLGVLTCEPCLLRNRKLTCNHLLESLNGMPMNDTKNIKRKLLRCGNIRILFMINKHLYLYLYVTITYDYVLLHSMIRQRRAPLGPPFWGLFGDHLVWSCRDHAASHPRTECPSSPQPIPLGEVGLRRFCETRGGGGIKGLFATRNSFT